MFISDFFWNKFKYSSRIYYKYFVRKSSFNCLKICSRIFFRKSSRSSFENSSNDSFKNLPGIFQILVQASSEMFKEIILDTRSFVESLRWTSLEITPGPLFQKILYFLRNFDSFKFWICSEMSLQCFIHIFIKKIFEIFIRKFLHKFLQRLF